MQQQQQQLLQQRALAAGNVFSLEHTLRAYTTPVLYALLLFCMTVVFIACFAHSGGDSSGDSGGSKRPIEEGLKVRQQQGSAVAGGGPNRQEALKMKKKPKISGALKKVAAVAKGAAKGAAAGAAADGSGAAGEGGTVIRIPPQPDFALVAKQINDQLTNLSKPQLMEIAKRAKEVITDMNDKEQKLEDELNKL